PYHTRAIGGGPQAHLENLRAHLDWLFRLKATGTFRHTIGSRAHSSLPDKVAATADELACARVVSDYARARGIITMQNGSVALGSYPDDQNRPGFDQMMVGRDHYHSWARHDLHTNLARNMASFCHEAGFDQAFIHAVDSGGILDPEMWSQRDALTREQYGDDRVSADADMFNIYADEFATAGAEIVFVAYPYSAQYLSREFVMRSLGLPDNEQGRARADGLVEGMRIWMRGINAKLAPGVRMCIREAAREDMFSFFDGYPGRPMWIYWELTHYRNSIYPLLTTNIRCIGTAYSPERPAEDIIWANDIDYSWFSEPIRAACCEYAWNTRFPGSKPYDPAYMAGGEPEVDDQAALDIVAQRAAVGLWGAQAAPLMQRALATHLSWRAAVDPKKATERLQASTLAPLVRKNRQAAHDACDAMDELWRQAKQARVEGRDLMDGFAYPFFVQFYAMTTAARAYADVHLRELQATEAIRAGDMEQATREMAQGREELAANVAAYERTMAELKDEPWVIGPAELSASWAARPEGQLIRPDFVALGKRFDDLQANSDRLYQEYNIPEWFRDWFGPRSLTAVKARGEVKLDGVLDEPDWQAAPPVDEFVGHQQYKVMAVPCEARLMYDGRFLYLGARLRQPLIGQINEPTRPLANYSFTEQVELLLVPGEAGAENLYQFVVDTGGNLFTMRRLVAAPGPEQVTEGWDCQAQAAVSRGQDGWSLELAVPIEALAKPVGGTWHAVIARDLITSLQPRQVETYASAFFDGRSYHTAELHSPLHFVADPAPVPEEPPGLHLTAPTMRTRTTERGQGSEVTFGVTVETRHPLLGAIVRAEVLDREGRVLGATEAASSEVVSVKLSTPRPVSTQLDTEQQGVTVRLVLNWHTLAGEQRELQRRFILGDVQAAVAEPDRFAEGVSPGTKAVTVPVSVPLDADGERLLSLERGTVEFWLRPRTDMALLPERWGERFVYLFHYGPQKPAGSTSPGGNSISICHERKGWISLTVYSPDGDRRLVHSRLPNWLAGEWHHLACTWDLTEGGQSRLGLYLDGHQSAQNQWGRKGGVEDRGPMTMQEGAWLAQLGGLNSGMLPADADYDELRVWSFARYSEDFTPERETATPPVQGLLHLGFEGDLTGHFRTAAREGTVLGQVGAPEH
ncbi:MAG TPA: LamG-like jellyroll fold domain-containing protein, partial [Armatimonadota bacterium]|nr:LamG-like jellyroll fold domain-containing protein [Armatimonadota bacterium]